MGNRISSQPRRERVGGPQPTLARGVHGMQKQITDIDSEPLPAQGQGFAERLPMAV
jgi:hypothetical protein